jgi:hypothetical protein
MDKAPVLFMAAYDQLIYSALLLLLLLLLLSP